MRPRLTAGIASVALAAAAAGTVTGLVLTPGPGDAAPRPTATPPRAPTPTPSPGDTPARATRHLALNLPAADHAKAAALGYDLFDLAPDAKALDALPKGAQALLWTGGTPCEPSAGATRDFTATVKRFARHPRVYGWYLADEPDPKRCPGITARIRERAAIVHRHAPGHRAFASLTDWNAAPPRAADTGLDLVGLDPYPCRATAGKCDLEVIDRMVGQAARAGFTREKIVPVYQTFGQQCVTGAGTGGRAWRLPTAAQLQAILDRWRTLVPAPAFDVSYSWSRQPRWACPSLADADGTDGHPDLQAVMKRHNTRDDTGDDTGDRAPAPPRQPGKPPVPAGWGAPVVTEDFDGTRLDPAKWVVYDTPDARVNPRTDDATRVADGTLRLTGALYGGKDLSGGIASRLNQRYGRWEVRMRADPGKGYSAVALLWPERFGDPEKAEINFAEVIDPTRKTTGLFVHQGLDGDETGRNVRADFTRWRTVALDWRPGSLTYWIDGRKVWHYTGRLLPQHPRTRMGLALQMDQICDRGPRFCRDRTTPAKVTMEVDWVRIHRLPET
ncbi:hypothetical protein GCM10009678_01540 [Actinomadura kijaniata]|uniref:GH16 domain-containing protein n=1 Tax=Actinomadura namibiensis TaxID=182080 RepID=A0A7W3QN72_ACTNM|nr:glycoside hydrolase family 16 protein [Actinomadura namibiensis]MBA8953320.1 hypothetical protein [Actinomadura namibiensis]